MSYKNPTAKPEDFKPNDGVIYWSGHGTTESGVVTSTNNKYVFVRYGDNRQSQATDPRDLTNGYYEQAN